MNCWNDRPAEGIGGEVKGINFYIDAEERSIGVESICVPGDYHEFVSGHATQVGAHLKTRRVHAHRNAQAKVADAPKILALAVGAMMAIATLSSCSSVARPTMPGQSGAEATPAMLTPDEAKREVRVLYEGTRDLMPGDWFEDTHGWVHCVTSDGAEGAYYDFFSQRRAQPLPADPKPIVEQVQTVWARLGHTVEIARDETLSPPRYILSDPAWMAGSGPDGLLLQFTIGDEYADFIGTSRCVAGDSLELGLSE